ncbi:Zn(II)2Cys6 transcription factor domain-containing protein [Aspergillus alliaceus]|uniref:Zn(II)2Cys6 transcription factor domain-containing protein n=1 Tax=Petromyces alliaceus TaxID=209559 RepID=UPI0012A3E0C3|nr:uncharacterized protein BDW43DRAFT_316586 [Aspergillus alliaceus]KAB8227683.1 hypothetical protein BDW43DRAFT_316586 [Aspergillus alliaceus]
MNGERKLRAACDRCHELKNRCTRAGGPESRCDRCERLDIDCVYNTSARMGRPRVSRPGSENQKGASSARHSKRRAVQAGSQRGANAVPLPVDHVDLASAAHDRSGGAGPGSGPSSGSEPDSPRNLEPVLGILDPALLPAVVPGDNVIWDLGLYSPDFAHPAHDDPTGGQGHGRGHGHAHREYHQVESLQQKYKEVPDFSDSDLEMSEKGTVPIVKTTVADELLRLQFHLSNLLTGASESPTGHQPAIDEVMMVCKELLELLPIPARRSSSDYGTASKNMTGTGPPFTPASVNAGHPDPCDGIGQPTQRGGGPFDPLRINYITVLQVATSYAYALQLLDLAVDNLKTRAGNLALVSLGTFNLASQPAMSTSVGAYMISSMVHQLRDAISLLTPEYQHQQGRPPPHASSPPSGLQAAAAAANNSIHAAVDMISEKETSLLEKLAQVMINS